MPAGDPDRLKLNKPPINQAVSDIRHQFSWSDTNTQPLLFFCTKKQNHESEIVSPLKFCEAPTATSWCLFVSDCVRPIPSQLNNEPSDFKVMACGPSEQSCHFAAGVGTTDMSQQNVSRTVRRCRCCLRPPSEVRRNS